ncbi:MAG TPA: toll/interleukin-1 receptor domain-containing protein [Ramlibacter sp.]|jgi:hypothetical protein|uniref:toll/interleukin-1 receptor domain-containing protein n=1 Tax=Ramlibacter sp. TaxID=1917967 RepID=UPI002D4D4B11|nr:toll/interleukin-1 receptor domain-containing protein [Ramlibacter sp.]HZY18874.1 toll/interleukin-1 receptor domain-containing protein [Ramlibacter sp.]
MTTIFFSYSHADEDLRNRLDRHLAMLRHQGLVDTWHDRRITAGAPFDDAISENLERADIILLLVSSDFLSSEYCYAREMHRAMERHQEGTAVVIPVILRPCDWHPAPFGKLMGVPTDGKPVTSWPNHDEAFVDIARQVRRVVEERAAPQGAPAALPAPAAQRPAANPQPSTAAATLRSSNLRLRKEFTERDRDQFLHESFDRIASTFEGSLQALAERNDGIEGDFRRVDINTFTAIIYKGGKSVSQCCVRLGDFLGQGISYSNDANPRGNSFNESMTVQADQEALYFTTMGFTGSGQSRLSAEAAAEHLWSMLIRPLQ